LERGESDPGWVGAWWMRYVLCGVISILISVPFYMFLKKYLDTDFMQEKCIKKFLFSVKKEDLNVRFHISELPCQLLDLY